MRCGEGENKEKGGGRREGERERERVQTLNFEHALCDICFKDAFSKHSCFQLKMQKHMSKEDWPLTLDEKNKLLKTHFVQTRRDRKKATS